jgi:hypothetical protein
MASEDPQIRLLIDQPLQNSAVPNATPVCNPGEILCGHLELSTKNDVDISDISIYFEGMRQLERNSVSIYTIHRYFAELDPPHRPHPARCPLEGGAQSKLLLSHAKI